MKWKPIKDTDGLYLISDDAKVFSVRNGRLLKPQQNRQGYWRVELNVNGNTTRPLLHRLVAQAFIPNPKKYPCINHKDENPSNNNASNLEWCTHKYNSNYGTRLERFKQHRTAARGKDNSQSKVVYQFDLEGNFIGEYESSGDAGRKTGLPAGSIARAAAGKRNQYAGFYWSYEKKYDYHEPIKTGFRKGAVLMCDGDTVVKRYETPEELKADGYSQIQINRVCRGERNIYKGYSWKHEGE